MKNVILIACLTLLSTVVNADWVVDQTQSDINFLSTKISHVTEVHSFKSFTGGITDEGVAGIEIDLSSVSTGIEIRDTRLLEHLFNVSTFTTAKLTASIPQELLARIKQGEAVVQVLKGQVDLHGVTQELSAKVKFVNTDKGLHVASVEPLLIMAKQFALVEGIEVLRKLANLSSISYTVPVTFSLVLLEK